MENKDIDNLLTSNEIKQNKNLLDLASSNAVKIENSITSFTTKSLGNADKLDLMIDELVGSIQESLPDMNANEKLNAIRTLSTIRNSQASTALNAMNSDSTGTTLLDKLRDRELSAENTYEKTFQSVKNKPDISLGFANLGKLLELLEGKSDKENNLN